MLALKILAILFLSATGLGFEKPVITTPLGKIRGHYKTSFNGRKFSAFEGIPYAKPPIGEKRFEAPEPIDKWERTWEATSLYECAQTHSLFGLSTMSGDEDCLYINVYVPRDRINCTENLDVIVHIHGGGFMALSGHSYSLPGYLMDRDVIFVTFNYRLGVLGFLSTEDDVLPGNNGMKDQVLALKWVQDNIGSFGGNPGSVTLTGASAGGASVQLHYLSPMSAGLFQKGFSQSRCALSPWAIQKGALDKARKLALAVNCPETPNERLKMCLKQRPYRQMLAQIGVFGGYKNHPLVPFGPVIEKGSKPFLVEHPRMLLARKQVQDLPWMVSFVEQDGYGPIAEFRNDTRTINQNWEQGLPFVFFFNYSVPREQWGNASKRIKDFYFGKDKDLTDDNFDSFVRLSTDMMTLDGSVKSVLLQSAATNAPVYLFDLSYTGDTKNIISHAEDLQYFYYDENEKPLTKNELKMKDLLINMLVLYAKTGTPSINEIIWKPVKTNEINFLNISDSDLEHIHLQTNNDLGNQNFWNSLEF